MSIKRKVLIKSLIFANVRCLLLGMIIESTVTQATMPETIDYPIILPAEKTQT